MAAFFPFRALDRAPFEISQANPQVGLKFFEGASIFAQPAFLILGLYTGTPSAVLTRRGKQAGQPSLRKNKWEKRK
jgi:hypothetical protein